ncbi:hypothetical protein [Faecalimicrobium sp. JNUCC 81]
MDTKINKKIIDFIDKKRLVIKPFFLLIIIKSIKQIELALIYINKESSPVLGFTFHLSITLISSFRLNPPFSPVLDTASNLVEYNSLKF